jgi:hypothetical protein
MLKGHISSREELMWRGIATSVTAGVALGGVAWLLTHATADDVQNISLFSAGLSGARRWLTVMALLIC